MRLKKTFPAVSIVIFLALANPVWAKNGTDLLRMCKSAEAVMDRTIGNESNEQSMQTMMNAGQCVGLVGGIRDTMFFYDTLFMSPQVKIPEKIKTCWPSNYPSIEQSIRIVIKYLRDNPNQLHEQEHFLVIQALHNAFPCGE